MCDPMMLALWLWGAIFWIEGLDSEKPSYLAISVLLIAASALTKSYEAKKNGQKLFDQDRRAIQQFERKELTARLAAELSRLIK